MSGLYAGWSFKWSDLHLVGRGPGGALRSLGEVVQRPRRGPRAEISDPSGRVVARHEALGLADARWWVEDRVREHGGTMEAFVVEQQGSSPGPEEDAAASPRVHGASSTTPEDPAPRSSAAAEVATGGGVETPAAPSGDDPEWGASVRARRQERGWSREHLSAAVGVSTTVLSYAERGIAIERRVISPGRLVALRAAIERLFARPSVEVPAQLGDLAGESDQRVEAGPAAGATGEGAPSTWAAEVEAEAGPTTSTATEAPPVPPAVIEEARRALEEDCDDDRDGCCPHAHIEPLPRDERGERDGRCVDCGETGFPFEVQGPYDPEDPSREAEALRRVALVERLLLRDLPAHVRDESFEVRVAYVAGRLG